MNNWVSPIIMLVSTTVIGVHDCHVAAEEKAITPVMQIRQLEFETKFNQVYASPAKPVPGQQQFWIWACIVETGSGSPAIGGLVEIDRIGDEYPVVLVKSYAKAKNVTVSFIFKNKPAEIDGGKIIFTLCQEAIPGNWPLVPINPKNPTAPKK
ncbi:hypothetical protein [Zavarzinella formosa]|uniref:hypothetical protein n=1 Tax=Zavarzinella formosa TaxID=360055 RepID=UPI00035F17DC|nr:hypothetical protein [Zavarzinella formosa]